MGIDGEPKAASQLAHLPQAAWYRPSDSPFSKLANELALSLVARRGAG